jgi:hypothetical protein
MQVSISSLTFLQSDRVLLSVSPMVSNSSLSTSRQEPRMRLSMIVFLRRCEEALLPTL